MCYEILVKAFLIKVRKQKDPPIRNVESCPMELIKSGQTNSTKNKINQTVNRLILLFCFYFLIIGLVIYI